MSKYWCPSKWYQNTLVSRFNRILRDTQVFIRSWDWKDEFEWKSNKEWVVRDKAVFMSSRAVSKSRKTLLHESNYRFCTQRDWIGEPTATSAYPQKHCSYILRAVRAEEGRWTNAWPTFAEVILLFLIGRTQTKAADFRNGRPWLLGYSCHFSSISQH